MGTYVFPTKAAPKKVSKAKPPEERKRKPPSPWLDKVIAQLNGRTMKAWDLTHEMVDIYGVQSNTIRTVIYRMQHNNQLKTVKPSEFDPVTHRWSDVIIAPPDDIEDS